MTPFDYLKDSPMFQLSLSSKELFHSNFLAWIGSWYYGDEKKRGIDHPFRQLMKGLGASHVDEWPETWYVAREFRNFDLCVLNRMPEEFESSDEGEKGVSDVDLGSEGSIDTGIKDTEPLSVLFVLENKVKSIPYSAQLNEYEKKVLDINFHILKKENTRNCKWMLIESEWKKRGYDESKYLEWRKPCQKSMGQVVDYVLLSMSDSFPDRHKIILDNVWIICSYDLYVEKLGVIKKKISGFNRRILIDYIDQLKALLNLHREWCPDNPSVFEDTKFLYFSTEQRDNVWKRTFDRDYLKLKELRIHDLFHKQRYAMMCAILRQKIVDNYPGLKFSPNNNLIKDIDSDVSLAQNLLHGEPLIDIQLRSLNKDITFTIQVQADSYEHGFHYLKKESANNFWNNLKGINGLIGGNDGWMCEFDANNCIISGNGAFKILDKDIFRDDLVHPKKAENQRYYGKYENTTNVFIYQSRRINSQKTIAKVLEYIFLDFTKMYTKAGY